MSADEPAGAPFITTFEVAWGDCDAAGIAFYPRLFAIMDQAFQRLLRARGTGQRALAETLGVIGTPLVEAAAQFRSPARFDDEIVVEVRVERVARKTFRIGYEGRVGDRVCFEGHELRALAARDDQGAIRAIAVPEAFREQLLAR